MKSHLLSLFFDKELVRNIKKGKFRQEVLYNNLMSGKITLQEYLAAIS